MKTVILCEGKTDAVLISYYLGKACGWEIVKPREYSKYNDLKGFNIRIAEVAQNQNMDWYKRGPDFLLICAVGGKDNYRNFYNRNIYKPLIMSDHFDRIVIIIDHDIDTIADIEEKCSSIFANIQCQLTNRNWNVGKYENGYGEEKEIPILVLVIPPDCEGALESVLLRAIKENEYDKVIVEMCETFVKDIRTYAEKYITNDRLELKARLSTTWAIQTPEKAFDFIDEQLRSIEWEKYDELKECFKELHDL